MMIRNRTRFLSVLLSGALVLSGCAGGQTADGTGETTTQADTAASAATVVESVSSKEDGETAASGLTETDRTDEETVAVNETSEDIAFVRFSNTTGTVREEEKNNERASVSLTYDTLAVENTASDGETTLTALSRRLSELEYMRRREADDAFESFREKASLRNAQEKYACALLRKVSVLRADTRVFSYLEEQVTTVDTAGASVEEEEEIYRCFSRNLDAGSGEEIRLEDVVNDMERLGELAAEAIRDKYDTTNPAYNAAEQFEGIDLSKNILALLEADDGGESGTFAWSPAYYGLRLVLSRQAVCEETHLAAYLEEVAEINAHDLNCFDVTIPYTAERSLFEPSFTMLPAAHIARLEAGAVYEADFGDGPVPLQIVTPRKYENNTVLYTGECIVQMGDGNRQSFDLVGAEEYANYGVSVYLVKTEEADYLYLDVTGRDETDRLHVYAIEDGTVRFVGVSEEMLDNDRLPPFDPDSFMTEGICYILPDPFLPDSYTGTRGFRESRVSSGGMPKSDERFYLAAEEDVRVTAMELNLDTLQDPDDDRPEKETYPAGTTLTMWRVERSSHADLKADDGRIVRLYINGVDTIDLIDGHELHEAFADPRESGHTDEP